MTAVVKRRDSAGVCVLAPVPLLTVTLEQKEARGDADIHLHPGGQGFWIARLIAKLGVDVTLCAAFGGETGRVVQSLLSDEPMMVRPVQTSGTNGAYVDDRRTGERVSVGVMPPAPLTRHEVDDLYGVTLAEALDSSLCVLGGPGPDSPLPAELYERLTTDLVGNGRTVIADLSGEPLDAAVRGGATVVKVSHEELLRDGRVQDDRVPTLLDAMAQLAGRPDGAVICTRCEQPALVKCDGRTVEVRGPQMQTLDDAGAGDSFTAGLAAALSRDESFEAALQLGAAAGALNVTRRGRGTGERDAIHRVASHVEVVELETKALAS